MPEVQCFLVLDQHSLVYLNDMISCFQITNELSGRGKSGWWCVRTLVSAVGGIVHLQKWAEEALETGNELQNGII